MLPPTYFFYIKFLEHSQGQLLGVIMCFFFSLSLISKWCHCFFFFFCNLELWETIAMVASRSRESNMKLITILLLFCNAINQNKFCGKVVEVIACFGYIRLTKRPCMCVNKNWRHGRVSRSNFTRLLLYSKETKRWWSIYCSYGCTWLQSHSSNSECQVVPVEWWFSKQHLNLYGNPPFLGSVCD